MSEPFLRRPGRSLFAWVAIYLSVAAALSFASRVLDDRQKYTTGLTRTIYEGDLDTGILRGRDVTSDIDLRFVDRDPALPRRLFSVRWSGVLVRDRTEWVDVHAGGDDEMVVVLDDQVVIDRNPPQSRGEGMARLLLTAGVHRFEVRYRQEGGGYSLYVLVGPAGKVPGRIDPESIFPREPPARRLQTNHRLRLLRRVAAAMWVVPPGLFLLVVGRRPAWRAAGRAWRTWRIRTRLNLAKALTPPSREADAAARPTWRRGIVALHAAAVVLFLLAIAQFRSPEFGFTGLIRFGGQFERQVLPSVAAVPRLTLPGSGYDGQFYAQLAIDPTLRDPNLDRAIDSLPYRSRRILLSWMAFVIGFGQPAWILQVYALLNVFFWILLGVVLLRWLPPVSLRNWFAWVGCMFGFGAVASVHSALTDLPSVSLAALGLALAETGRTRLGACLVGLCGLARETTVLAGFGFDWFRMWRERARATAGVTAALVGAPLMLWSAYMVWMLGRAALYGGDRNLVVPFSGIAEYVGWLASDLAWSGWGGARSIPGLFAFLSLLVQAAYLVWRAEWHRSWWRVGMSYVLLVPILGFAVWEGDVGAFVRVTLPLAIAFNISASGSRWFWPLLILGNMTVPHALGQLGFGEWW
ncbi:MAG: hypothetical protein AB7Q29_10405 [Vicinamibacterales bacterium]